ncbi:trypsin-like [Episyrphus balteatus]|uniref:trypsin-like n=1 Tax=Episyrphus balteatus TaxID=286459 RepID=UPI002485ADEE|nr:trypsin-like [Episyrphus balteatus]
MNCKIFKFTAFIISCSYIFKTVQCDSVDARIYGGSEIQITDAPYQVSIRLKVDDAYKFGYGHVCGGSLITSRIVLTAAHCIAASLDKPIQYRSPRDFTLVMGDTYLIRKISGTLQFDVQQIVVHPNFNKPASLENDIAMMFFSGNVPSNQNNVHLIALNKAPLAANTLCNVSGWGKINSVLIPNNLMQATVPIVPQTTCERSYGRLPQTMMCAGFMATGGVDACQGDSGGPFVCNNKLAGVVSWGTGCGLPGYPGVYTNVSSFVGWIEQTNATFNYSYYSGGSSLVKKSLILIVLSLFITVFKMNL